MSVARLVLLCALSASVSSAYALQPPRASLRVVDKLPRSRSAAPLLAAAGADALVADGGKGPSGATVPTTIVNLAKNIVGSGVLSLAAGVAAFSGSPLALFPSIALLSVICAMSAYTFTLIARVGASVGATSYAETWGKVFGKETQLLPAFVIVFKTYVGALSYAIILGDSAAGMAAQLGAPPLLRLPNVWIGLLTTFVLTPLCLMRDLSSLAFGSVVGTIGTLYTAAFMSLRALDKSYQIGGVFHSAIGESLRPRFTPASGLNLSIFVLLSMLSTTFMAHYNAPKFFNELSPAEGGAKSGGSEGKLGRFNTAAFSAFGLAGVLCATIMTAGFLTFGASANGLILNNYATSDPLAFIARCSYSFRYTIMIHASSSPFINATFCMTPSRSSRGALLCLMAHAARSVSHGSAIRHAWQVGHRLIGALLIPARLPRPA